MLNYFEKQSTLKIYNILIRYRSAALVYLTHRMALPILRLIRKPEIFPYSRAELDMFPPGTLGKDLADFVHTRQLILLPYYARHDMKHILLEYETTDEGEVCLQCFMLGNGHVSFPVIATVLYGILTMPEYWAKFRKAYRRGRHTIPIKDWDWFSIVHDETPALRKKINKTAHG